MKLFRRSPKPDTPPAAETAALETPAAPSPSAPAQPPESPARDGLFSRLKKGLSRTGSALGEGIGNLVLGRKQIDAALFEDIEMQLLMADLGIETTQAVMEALTRRVAR